MSREKIEFAIVHENGEKIHMESYKSILDKKYKKIYDMIETQYKIHNFNKDSSFGDRNYNMIMRLIKSLDRKEFDRDLVYLAAMLFGVEQKAIKLMAYDGEPDFATAQEFLEYHGVPNFLAEKVDDYLVALRREFYVDWSPSDDENKSESDIDKNKKLLDTIEGKMLCDMVRLGRIGALGLVRIIKESDYIYDPWECERLQVSDDAFLDAVAEINKLLVKEWDVESVFYTKEARQIAQQRIKFMKVFAREYELEAKGKDGFEETNH